MIINFDYNVAENIIIVIKIKNKILLNITLKQNFRNKYIKKNVFNENTKFLIK